MRKRKIQRGKKGGWKEEKNGGEAEQKRLSHSR